MSELVQPTIDTGPTRQAFVDFAGFRRHIQQLIVDRAKNHSNPGGVVAVMGGSTKAANSADDNSMQD